MPTKTLNFDEVGRIAMALTDVKESSLHGASIMESEWKIAGVSGDP